MDEKICKAISQADELNYAAIIKTTDTSEEFLNAIMKKAAYHGYTKCMKLLRQRGATDFETATIHSVYNGHIKAFQLLHQWGVANLEMASMLAGKYGKLDILKYLHRHEISLEEAMCKADPATLQFIIDLGISQDTINKIAAHIAIDGDCKKFEVILAAKPTNLDALAAVAASTNRIEILILLHYRAEFIHGFALYYAVKNGHFECANMLAEWDTDPIDAMLQAVDANDITAMLFIARLPGWTLEIQQEFIKDIKTPEQLVCMMICWLNFDKAKSFFETICRTKN